MAFVEIETICFVVSPVHAKAPRKLTMHDLVYDLAKIIAGDEVLVMDVNKPTTWDKANEHYCRHAQLVNYHKRTEIFKHIPCKIRTLYFRECPEMQLPRKAFSRSRYIRMLDLSRQSAEEQSTPSSPVLPSSICRLMLLGYLDVSGFPIISLPKSFHTLQNMQSLILSNCSLEILPANIGSLQKLCYLDLSSNSNLNKLPPSVTNLVELYFLNLSGCAKLEELPESIQNLNCLQQLDMSGCCALQKLPDKFGSLNKLLYITLASCSKLTELPNKLNLESLEHLNLSSCNELEALPGDFGNLSRLEVLNLSDCYKVKVLPETFCQLKHLKDLNLSDCHGLKQLPECFGDLSELQYLNLTSCSKLQSLPQSFCKIHKLKHLNLSYCIKLENLPDLFGDLKLQVLELSGCFGLEDLPDSINEMTSLTLLDNSIGSNRLHDTYRAIRKRLNLPGYEEHVVHMIENGQISSIVELEQLHCRTLAVRHLEIVEELDDARRAKLRNLAKLRDLMLSWGPGGTVDADKGKMVLENLVPPRTLEKFSLRGLRGYLCKDFPNWVSGISSYLPYLIQLSLFNLPTCDSLPAFGQLPNLRNFGMDNMPSIRKIGKEFYGEEGNCKKLRVIRLERMDNLEEWWTTRSGKEDEEFLIPNLHYLHVVNCPKLSFLPYPPISMAWTLDGSNEVLPERGFGSLVSSTLPFAVTIKNCHFSPDRWGRLQHLATLEIFRVDGCSGLRTLPDIIQCFISLGDLGLRSWEDLETLPEWLGQLGCEGLEILPEWLGLLISLKKLLIIDCPKLIFLPESMKNLTSLIELHL
uniref:Uncharacterized protein n=1 Tax=Oryza glumipatula TaxID=40148 RepID=A0A0D9YJS7_9ORYZ